MSTHLLARRGLALVVVAFLAIGLAGCGDYHDDDYYYYGGTLAIENDVTSFEVIDFVHVWVPGGPVETFAMFLLPGEIDYIDFYPDSYDVELEWSDGLIDYFPGVDIFDGETTLIVGVN